MSLSDPPYKRHTYTVMGRYRSVKPDTQHSKRPTHGSYGSLLFDSRWKEKRKEILARDKNQCIICHSNDELQIHHRQYHYLKAIGKFKPPWDYDNQLLITLCSRCHQKGHNNYDIPIINI